MNFLNSLIGKMNFLDSPISEKEYLQKVLTICFPKDHSSLPQKDCNHCHQPKLFSILIAVCRNMIYKMKLWDSPNQTTKLYCFTKGRHVSQIFTARFLPIEAPSLPDNVVFAGNQSYLNFAKVWMGKWKKNFALAG